MYDAVGPIVTESLPGFHAMTGCDTTGKFSGKGKVTCWNTLKAARPNVITTFGQLGKTNTHLMHLRSLYAGYTVYDHP